VVGRLLIAADMFPEGYSARPSSPAGELIF